MNQKYSSIDLHVHTCFSENAGDWLLKTIGANESYTTPQQVYQIAKSRGMDFVTISDHDTIDGALEIAHYDDFFISEEVTTFFPEDNAKVHVVCLDINENIHREIQHLRYNIYELVQYLYLQNIIHFIAHPFFKMGRTLTMEHFEKMLLLFQVFETKNGGKQLVPDKLLKKILKGLTIEDIDRLAMKHGIDPIGLEPWTKSMVAGSDDHGGILITCPHTVCQFSENKYELLENIRTGNCRAHGYGGSMLSVAHQVMAVSYKHAKHQNIPIPHLNSQVTQTILDNMFEKVQNNRIADLTTGFLFSLAKFPGLRSLFVPEIVEGPKQAFQYEAIYNKRFQRFLTGNAHFDALQNKQFFKSMCRITHTSIVGIVEEITSPRNNAGVLEKLSLIKPLLSLLPVIVPYAIAARTEYQDRHLMRQAANTFTQNGRFYRGQIAVFSEGTYARSCNHRLSLRLLGQETISRQPMYMGIAERFCKDKNVIIYKMITSITLNPEKNIRIKLPPFLKVLYDLVNKDYEMIYISSFGSMAITGTLIGRLLNIPVAARFPHRQVMKWLDSIKDRNKYKIVQYCIRLFYNQMQEIQVSGQAGYDLLISLNIKPEKITRTTRKSVSGIQSSVSGPQVY